MKTFNLWETIAEELRVSFKDFYMGDQTPQNKAEQEDAAMK